MTAQITEVHGRPAVITLTGRLDQTTDWQLCKVVADCMARDLPFVVLDLASLDFCDEAGLHALSGAAAGTKVIGGTVHLAAPAANPADR
ncbi:STAS domain-containing protein [Streptomyces sp. ISL-99]|uniref:STAS domain-containing protein n=1 Tax=Streptomyces sp. ISL-99 TaxID=2819193 RepID=UPI001BEBA8E3|nr:STAS domain-containing protein [Streptomyces sp. ISL-99]MBT2529971.1 STAS domain-containing protein [Streptomyces sp. ISL-99]